MNRKMLINGTVNSVLDYLIGNITPNELEERMPDLDNKQWHRLAVIRLAYENSRKKPLVFTLLDDDGYQLQYNETELKEFACNVLNDNSQFSTDQKILELFKEYELIGTIKDIQDAVYVCENDGWTVTSREV